MKEISASLFLSFLFLAAAPGFAAATGGEGAPRGAVTRALATDPEANPNAPPSVVELSIGAPGGRMPGHLYLANGPGPHPTVVLLHGLPGNEKNLDLAQIFRRGGFNVLFFHYRGAWGAEGSYRISEVDDDARDVLAWLREPDVAPRMRVDPDRLTLVGHSVGGYAALAAAANEPSLQCVAALSPANPGDWKRELDALSAEELAPFRDYINSLFMLADFDWASYSNDMRATPMAELDTPQFAAGLKDKSVLMVVGDQDAVTPRATMFDPPVAAYLDAGVPLEHAVISGDHSYSWNRIGLATLLLEWLSRECQ
jgi:pimeloyl-ACP methyl ester carboxylesterase